MRSTEVRRKLGSHSGNLVWQQTVGEVKEGVRYATFHDPGTSYMSAM